MAFLGYDPTTGEIKLSYVSDDEDLEAAALSYYSGAVAGESNVPTRFLSFLNTDTGYDPALYYVLVGADQMTEAQVAERPEFHYDVTKTSIASDGIEQWVVSWVYPNVTVSPVNPPDQVEVTSPVTDGTFEFTSTTAARWSFRFESFPHKATVVDVEVV